MAAILLVENQPNQRLLYQIELEDAGYRVVPASGAGEAIWKLEQDRPDLLVLDPGKEKHDEVASLLQKSGVSYVPVIIYSTGERPGSGFPSFSCEAHVVKCSNIRPLMAEIRRVLSEAV